MQNLIQLLEKTLVEARETKAQHAQQIEALTSAFDQKLTQERVELIEAYETKIIDLRNAYALDMDQAREEIQGLNERTEEARELLAKVETQTVGVLPTENIAARMLFEKLAERWAYLNESDKEIIEAVLSNKNLNVWIQA